MPGVLEEPEILIIAILKHKRNRNFDNFSVKLICIDPCGIFIHGFATRENTAFRVHPMKYKSICH